MEMPKPVSSNDLIEPLNRNCIFISQLPIHSNILILPKLVNQYNCTYHRSTKTTSNNKEVWNSLYGKYQTEKKKEPAFKVGDKVWLNKKFRPFKKGYLSVWTEEVFQVRKVVPGMVTTYKVWELDETPLQGTFYVCNLQKVHVDEATYFVWKKY